jgi:fructose-specific component phosphotransferase system IIB-like protein
MLKNPSDILDKHAQYDWQRDMNNSIQDGRHLYSKLCEAERHITHIQDRDEALENYIRALETHIKGLSRRTMDAEKALGIVQSKLGDATAEMDHAIVLRAEDLQKAEEDARARQDRITALEAELAAVYAQAEGNQPQLVGTTTVLTVNTGILQPSRNANPSVTKAECLPARAKRPAPVPENGETNSDGLMKRPRVHRVVHSQRRVEEESNDVVQLHALPTTQPCRNVKMEEVEGNVRLPLTQDNFYQAVTQNERSELGWDVDRQTLLYESAAQARMIIQLQDELANARDVAVKLRLSLDLSAGRVEQAGDLLTQANEWMEETKLKRHQPSFEHFPIAIFDVARLIARTASASTAVAV